MASGKDRDLDIEGLYESIRTFNWARKRGGVGVHCRNGANRSAIWMVAYLVARCGVTPKEAFAYLHSLRHLVDISKQPDFGKYDPSVMLDTIADDLRKCIHNHTHHGFQRFPAPPWRVTDTASQPYTHPHPVHVPPIPWHPCLGSPAHGPWAYVRRPHSRSHGPGPHSSLLAPRTAAARMHRLEPPGLGHAASPTVPPPWGWLHAPTSHAPTKQRN